MAPRVASGFRVQARTLGTEFRHVAEHEPARRGLRAEHPEPGQERGGIGVVGVVDDLRAPQAVLRFQTPLRRPHRGKPLAYRVQTRTRGDRRRGGGGGVERVVRPGQREVDLRASHRSVERDTGSSRARPRPHPHIGVRAGAERHAASRSRQPSPQLRPRVVRVDDRHRVVRQILEQLALRARDALDAPEPFEMRRRALSDHSHRRPGESGERRDLATVVRPELDHRAAMPGIEAAERERDSNLVVEVAAGRRDRAQDPEDRGHHLLDRRLAVAAGDADEDEVAEMSSPCRGEVAERPRGIARENERYRSIRRAFDERRRRAARRRRADEVMAVEPRPAHRHEQGSGRRRTRIGADSAKCRVLPRDKEPERRGRLRETHADHQSTPRTFRTDATSLNGSLTPSHSWVVS